MNTLKIIGIGLLVIFGLFLLSMGLEYLNLVKFGYFAPKYENVKREVFENTQSYVEGKRQDLVKYRLEYLKSKDPQEKEALRQTIVQMFANFDEEKLTDPELKSFLHSMKFNVNLP